MMKYLESENNCYLVMEYCNRINMIISLIKRGGFRITLEKKIKKNTWAWSCLISQINA